MADTSAAIGPLRLRNPYLLASGILGETAQSLLRVIDSGACGVVTKSIGLEPRAGHSGPTVLDVEVGLLNAIGLANPGIDSYSEELGEVVEGMARGFPDAVIIGSIFASAPSDFSKLANSMADAGVNALELNLSCPHAKGFGADLSSDSSLVGEIVRTVKASVSIPVFAKLGAMGSEIVTVAEAVQEAGADAVVAINTLRAMAIDTELGRPILGNRVGGLSGPAIKPVGVRCVYGLFEKLSIPIIGVGGIQTGLDAVEYMMAGASAVQVGSAVYNEGPEVFGRLDRELQEFMDSHGYKSVKEMVGIAHK